MPAALKQSCRGAEDAENKNGSFVSLCGLCVAARKNGTRRFIAKRHAFRHISHMRKRYVILLTTISLSCVAGLIWKYSPPPEPVYQGHPLSYWLEGYDSTLTTETARQSADNALREAGTNAIPTLLRMLKERDSRLNMKFFALVEKQHIVRLHHVSARARNYYAMKGFELLGASAKSAVPSLIAIYESDISDDSQDFTARSLDAIGPAAKQAGPMIASGTNQSDIDLFAELDRIHADPELVVPELIKSIVRSKDNPFVPIYVLGRFHGSAKPAVSILTNLLIDSDTDIKRAILFALRQIDPNMAATLSSNFPVANLPPRTMP